MLGTFAGWFAKKRERRPLRRIQRKYIALATPAEAVPPGRLR